MKTIYQAMRVCLFIVLGWSCADTESIPREEAHSIEAIKTFSLEAHPEIVLAEYESEGKDLNIKFIETSPGALAMAVQFPDTADRETLQRYQALVDELSNSSAGFDEMYMRLAGESAKDDVLKKLKAANDRFSMRQEDIISGRLRLSIPTKDQMQKLAGQPGQAERGEIQSRQAACSPKSSSSVISFVYDLCMATSWANTSQFPMPTGAYNSLCNYNATTFSSDRASNAQPPFTDFYRVWVRSGDNHANAQLRIYTGTVQGIISLEATVLPGHTAMFHYFGVDLRSSTVQGSCTFHHGVLQRIF